MKSDRLLQQNTVYDAECSESGYDCPHVLRRTMHALVSSVRVVKDDITAVLVVLIFCGFAVRVYVFCYFDSLWNLAGFFQRF
uniref:Uncharacterized protein n=1 Tax=Ascaris lumbricoides TaxID=6252 RepID=A0A0M3IMG4_ASCLU